jgi:hypothetical protein
MRRVVVLAAAVLLCGLAIGCFDPAATEDPAGVPADGDSAAASGSAAGDGSPAGAEASPRKAADVLAAALAGAGRSGRSVFVHASAEW